MNKKYIGPALLALILILSSLSVIKFLVFKKQPQVLSPPSVPTTDTQNLKEAWFYEKLEGGRVACRLCPNNCLLADGQWGLCKARQNIGGTLYSKVYAKPTAIHVDPIEKKPFYHFLPGSQAYSLATTGCSLSCKYCQNWDIAQRFPEDVKSRDMTPEEVVEEALESGAPVIAFTYSEPIVWYEYMYDIAKLAKERGLRTVMVSSGYINQEPLEKLIPLMDAIKVDLKGFDEEYYQKIVGGKLEPVLETLKTLAKSEVHYEIVVLLVTGLNDSEEEIRKMCGWIKENLGTDVPLHFSRFHPDYKLRNLPPTPIDTIKRARQIAMEVGLKYVYTGNVPEFTEGNTTFCPDNNQPLIVRKGWFVEQNEVGEGGSSKTCPTKIPGVWE